MAVETPSADAAGRSADTCRSCVPKTALLGARGRGCAFRIVAHRPSFDRGAGASAARFTYRVRDSPVELAQR